MSMTISTNKQSGAVSLFVVVFTSLLITVITVSFVRIMINDQQQASVTDISQSAYDSALAGVEDAKRALIKYQSYCSNGGDCSTTSQAYKNVNSSECNVAVSELSDIDQTDDEVKIETGNENELDQAYTCVKVNMSTEDYLGSLLVSESNFIPLSTGENTKFDTIQLEWFSADDLSSVDNFNVNLVPETSASSTSLFTDWVSNRPPIMRAQLVQFDDSGFTLDDFESINGDGESNANTLFLYPTSSNSTINTSLSFSTDVRRDPSSAGKPSKVICVNNLSSGATYSCTVTIKLPDPINGNVDGSTRNAYLRLSSLYNKTNYRVTLLDSTNASELVNFYAVQPEVDSTGRTNDLLKRVKTRLELTDIHFPYPEATVDVNGSLCKLLRVTDDVDDYSDGCE